jgi:uncharacterized membrane protein YuzA (DUF378 family)
MEITSLLVLVLICLLFLLVVDRLVVDPKAKQIIYVILGIVAIFLLLNFFGVFGQWEHVHTIKP